MIAENQKFEVACISIVLVGIVLGTALLPVGSASALAGVKVVNPVHGHAKSKGQDVGYYYYGVKIIADAETALIFKHGKCSISDKKGKKYSKCWVHVAGASAGLSFSRQAPIMMKTLDIQVEGGKSSDVVKWNVSMVDGPQGVLEFNIPKDAYIIINFLWEVPEGFSPSGIKIGNLIKVSL